MLILLGNQNALIDDFAQKHALNLHKKHVKLKIFVKLGQIYKISASFSCFAFLIPKFAQVLKKIAQLCDCMIAAFRNSEGILYRHIPY